MSSHSHTFSVHIRHNCLVYIRHNCPVYIRHNCLVYICTLDTTVLCTKDKSVQCTVDTMSSVHRTVCPVYIRHNSPVYMRPQLPHCSNSREMERKLQLQSKNMMAVNCSCRRTKLTTFSCKDSKLRRLLSWYHHHRGELGLCIPKHYHSKLRVTVNDIHKLRYTEKNDLVCVLEAAETSLRSLRKQKEEGNASASKFKQQPITNYFFANEVQA